MTSQLQRIRSAIVRTPLDPALATVLGRAFDGLGEGPVSVRSSLTRDDRPAGSFAPQHGTYFAPDRAAAERNVQHCWAALWTDWARRHRPVTQLELAEPAVAIIVQRLVAAEASGVVFTADPTTGDRDTMVIESCYGLGEALAAAKVDPDRYRLARKGLALLEQELGDKSRELVIRDDGSIAELAVDPVRAWQSSLHPRSLSLVADLAARVAGVLGAPAAVEFALVDGEVWILQGRPIVFAA
jgi:pyruvate,water dikinase